MERILVTGAAGYIGRHVVFELLELGYEVYASDFNFKGVDSRATFIDYPIFTKEKDIYKKLGCPDIVIHLAWRDGFRHNSDSHMVDLSSHIYFLQNMIDSGLPMLTIMGSMHEVGYWEGCINEETPCNPQTMYGIAKNTLRQWALLYTSDKNTVLHWLRGYYIIGDVLRGSSVFSKIAEAVEAGKKVFPFTSGENKYDFIEINKLAKMIIYATIQKEINGIINVCSGKPLSLKDQVQKFIYEQNYEIELLYGAFPEREYDSPAIWGDAAKIQEIMRNANNEKIS